MPVALNQLQLFAANVLCSRAIGYAFICSHGHVPIIAHLVLHAPSPDCCKRVAWTETLCKPARGKGSSKLFSNARKLPGNHFSWLSSQRHMDSGYVRLIACNCFETYGTVGHGRYCMAQAESTRSGFFPRFFALDNLIISAERITPQTATISTWTLFGLDLSHPVLRYRASSMIDYMIQRGYYISDCFSSNKALIHCIYQTARNAPTSSHHTWRGWQHPQARPAGRQI